VLGGFPVDVGDSISLAPSTEPLKRTYAGDNFENVLGLDWTTPHTSLDGKFGDPVLTCGADRNIPTDPGVAYATIPTDEYSAVGFAETPDSPLSPSFVQGGDNTATATMQVSVDDGVHEIQTCTTIYTVVDEEDPVFTLCEDVFIETSSTTDLTNAAVTFDVAATDNVDVPIVTQLVGPANNSVVSIGKYTMSFTADDLSGNQGSCGFTLQLKRKSIFFVLSAYLVFLDTFFCFCFCFRSYRKKYRHDPLLTHSPSHFSYVPFFLRIHPHNSYYTFHFSGLCRG